MSKEQLNFIIRNQTHKEQSVTHLRASLEYLQLSMERLDNQLNQDLLATFSSKDQGKMNKGEVNKLNDNTRTRGDRPSQQGLLLLHPDAG